MNDKFVEYHSPDWEVLVESGWTTWTVEEVNGTKIARMRCFNKRWSR